MRWSSGISETGEEEGWVLKPQLQRKMVPTRGTHISQASGLGSSNAHAQNNSFGPI